MRFDDPHFAQFYDKEQRKSGYPGKLLEPLLIELKGYNSIIDIGAGSGFIAIPLLERGHFVTAIEPSKAMSDILLNKTPTPHKDKLSIINDRWENCSNLTFHDAAICIHSLYPMENIEKAILMMHASATKKIIIVRNSYKMKTLSGVIRNKIAPEPDKDLNDIICAILQRISPNYSVEEISERRLHKIDSLDEETKNMLFHLKLPESEAPKVKELISALSIYNGQFFFFESFFCDNMYIFF